jgi:hypothetical protein
VNEKELRALAKLVANEAHALATPSDFEELEKARLLRKIGKSYYTDNVRNLPEHVAKTISSFEQTKRGFKLTFHKQSRSMKRLSEESKGWR